MTYLKRNKNKTLFALALLGANVSPAMASSALPVAMVQQQNACKGVVVDAQGAPIIGALATRRNVWCGTAKNSPWTW